MNTIERNKNIYEEYMKGRSYEELSKKYFLTYNTIRCIIKDYRNSLEYKDGIIELAEFIEEDKLTIVNALYKRGILLEKLKELYKIDSKLDILEDVKGIGTKARCTLHNKLLEYFGKEFESTKYSELLEFLGLSKHTLVSRLFISKTLNEVKQLENIDYTNPKILIEMYNNNEIDLLARYNICTYFNCCRIKDTCYKYNKLQEALIKKY